MCHQLNSAWIIFSDVAQLKLHSESPQPVLSVSKHVCLNRKKKRKNKSGERVSICENNYDGVFVL